MREKKILVEKSEKSMIAEAVTSSENEKLDILRFVLGGFVDPPPGCNAPPDYLAYADSTYVKRPD